MPEPLGIDGEETALPDFEPDLEIGPTPFAQTAPSSENGDGIDSDSRLRMNAEEPPEPRAPKAGPPTLGEWEDFWSRIFLRVAGDWYIQQAFRGIDETLLSEREVALIQLSDEERKRISVPLAELSHKSKVMRRYGRTIVASGGAFDAIVAIGMWTSRVNRIARKYKPRTMTGRIVDERTRQSESPESADYASGANGGRVGGGWTIVNPGG